MLRRVAVIALVLGWTGCGNPSSNQPAGQKIWGKVTFDGQPVAKGTISFEPEDPGQSPSGAQFQSDGRYEVNVPPGRYKINIGKIEAPPPQAGGNAPLRAILVPLSKAPLTEEVTGSRELNFNLTSD
jgi:hypothetical protein